MIELFAQVWFLCAIAFLAGSAVTWLLFVRAPRRRPSPPPTVATARWAPERAASTPGHVRPAPPEPPPPAEPALANLDTHGGKPTPRHPGSNAAGALDRLGVGGCPRGPDDRPNDTRPTPEIPAQGGPVDEPRSGERW
jgi:hypothetical protein